MNRSKVAIVKANEYDDSHIRAAIETGLAQIGEWKSLFEPGARVFVKINHLSPPSTPERGIITHPVFARAVLGLLKDTGASITVGDDIQAYGEDGFAVSGFRRMCEEVGVDLVNLKEKGFVELRCDGERLKTLHLSRVVHEADIIVNLPKLKTHSLTLFTGGVKNFYGVIPVGRRTQFHGEHNRLEDFSQVLVDIFSMAKPHLTIMDAVDAMEGEGPGSGSVRRLGLILLSKDAVSVDAVASRLIGVDPGRVLTTRFAHERGLGVGELASIDVVGEQIESVSVPDFILPASGSARLVGGMPRFLVQFLTARLAVRPRVIKPNCVACRACERACPVAAIAVVQGKARVNRRTCIRCMCCHEVCRYGAIAPARSLLGAIIHGVMNAGRKLLALRRGAHRRAGD
jgi:uncharacterized protein (DUF362 family)/Pyruvate/2-oxoacid:ferredoxin oxidoreductase delta subunit